jgi:hypothetical protein
MRLVQTRDCDGACCRESPRWPNADRSDCLFHDHSCRIRRGEAEIPEESPVRQNMTGVDVFILDCLQWPQKNCRARIGQTVNCCWQWVDGSS